MAAVGAVLWLGQTLVLIVRGGVAPDATIESLTFVGGLGAFTVAAGLIGWGSAASRGPVLRAVLVALSVVAVPVAVLLGQAAMFALPGSYWFKSDVIVVAIAAVGLAWAVKELRRRE